MADRLRDQIEAWSAAGLIAPEQVEAILAHEAQRAATSSSDGRRPQVAEAVGYLGAVLTVAAGGLVIGEFWEQIAPWGRLLLTALLTLVVFLAGWVLRTRPHPAVQRLTSLLWFAATVGVAFTVGLATDQQELSGRAGALTVTAAIAVTATALYILRRTPLQLIAMSAGVAATAVALLAFPRASVDALYYGLLLYGLGTAWVLLALGRWLHPPRVALVLGLLAMGLGCQVGAAGRFEEAAIVLALATAATLIWASVRLDDTTVLAFGVGGIFLFVPQAVFRFFGESISAPLALLLTGLLLVAAAVGMITLRREITEEGS